MLYDGNRLVAQIDRARFSGANVNGVPLKDFSATIATRNDGVQIYAARAHIARRGEVLASGSVGRRNNVAVSVAQVDLSALRQKTPLQRGAASLAANISGTSSAPRVNGSALLRDGAIRGYPLNASGSFAYSNSALALNGATVALGPAYANIDGVVTPMLDLHATLQGADAQALAAIAQPRIAQQVAGTINADVRVRGNAAAPSIAGILDVPEGAYHGLAFRDLRANLNGNARTLAFNNGSVMVGTTAVAFNGTAGTGGVAGSVNAPHAELADFDDYFDTADTLGGHGSVRASFASNGGVISSSGAVALVDARYRRIPIGDAVAHWHNSGSRVVGDANIGGESGRLAFNGSADIARHDVRGRVSARNVDLRTWLPIAGIQAPVTGIVNGDANVAGAFPDVTIAARAAVEKGTFGRVAVHRLDVAADVYRGRGQLRSAHLQIPFFTASASGTFGLHPRDPIEIAMNAESPDLAALSQTISGHTIDANGSLRTTADLTGTFANPDVADNFSLDNLRYQNMRVPRVYGTVAANRKTIDVRNVQANLQRGTLALHGTVATTGAHAMNAQLVANDVEASNFVSLMPRGTKMNGRVDGTVTVHGTDRSPQFGGQLALRDGSYIGPAEAEPIAGAHAVLAFSGTGVALRNTSARVGGGTVVAEGAASMRDLRNPKTLAFNVNASADRARLNMPKYLRGEASGTLSVSHAAASQTMVAGNLFVPSARLPVSLFYNPNAPKTPSGPAPDVGFNLHVNVGNDVRVQSPNIDVGAQGALAVAGTLANPQLSGQLTSTGGTLDFFRRFFVQQGELSFDPANGIMPYVDAVATTTIPDPQANIVLHVTGLAPSNLNIAFQSDPPYNRDQILGLLVNAQAIGAVPGVKTANSGTPFSAGNQIQNLAMGQLDTFFTRSLFEPLSAQIGSQLGFQNFQLTGDFTGGLGLSAAKAFGKNITAMFAENMGTPRRQSLDVRAHAKKDSAIDLMMYQSDNPNVIGLFSQTSTANMNAFGNSTIPLFTGTNGFTLTYGHLWQ
jgi:autotransporter translocation and assembly factor TamB